MTITPDDLEPIRLQSPKEPNQADVERRAVELARAIPESLLRDYRALPEADQGRYVSADLMKEIFADYSASREGRARYNLAVHNAAAVLASAQYREAVQDSSDPKRTEALFITGVPGAGKTSAVLASGIPDTARVVYEGQLVDKSSHDKIAAAVDAGLNVKITAVMARLETALENTHHRYNAVGRGAPIATMARIHEQTPDGLLAIQARFGDRVLIEIIDNRDMARSRSLGLTEGVTLWRKEIDRGPATERLQTHLAAMQRDGRASPGFDRQAQGQAPDMGREPGRSHAPTGNEPGRAGENREARLLNREREAPPVLRRMTSAEVAREISFIAPLALNQAIQRVDDARQAYAQGKADKPSVDQADAALQMLRRAGSVEAIQNQMQKVANGEITIRHTPGEPAIMRLAAITSAISREQLRDHNQQTERSAPSKAAEPSRGKADRENDRER